LSKPQKKLVLREVVKNLFMLEKTATHLKDVRFNELQKAFHVLRA
jgi:hypothetical protein